MMHFFLLAFLVVVFSPVAAVTLSKDGRAASFFFMHDPTANFTSSPDVCATITCAESSGMICKQCQMTTGFVVSVSAPGDLAIVSMSAFNMSVHPQGTRDNYVFVAQDYFVHLYGFPSRTGWRHIVSAWPGITSADVSFVRLFFVFDDLWNESVY